MKKIAVFFGLREPLAYPLSKEDYWTSYSELTQVIAECGGQLYIVRSQDSYHGNGRFSNSWIIKGDELVEKGPLVADVIYDKGRFKSDGSVPVFNCQEVVDICLDKWAMYNQLVDYCPLTFYVENAEEAIEALKTLSTEKIVFKPVRGAEGIGVKIEDKQYFSNPTEPLQFPAVVSEFLDTSGGVPGLMVGHHDLRIALFDGEILYSYLRTPPNGSLLANVARGGTFMMIEPSRLPEAVVKIAQEIDERISTCPHRFYSVDFGYTAEGPKIIEMNSELGLLPDREHPVFRKLKEKLADVFMEM